MNVIVFMTDGRPNGLTADYSKKITDSCAPSNTPFVGVLAQWANGAVPTGTTAGLMNYTTNSITNANEGAISAGSGCKFYSDLTKVNQDMANLPTTDINGNSTTGPYSQENTASPYNGQATTLSGGISSPLQIVMASTNTLDNEATVIRSNKTLNPFIYDIALMGNGGASDQPDILLLRKMANDPSLASDTGIGQTFYNQQVTQPHGYFAVAPDASQLQVAFNSIAAHISIRLAQ